MLRREKGPCVSAFVAALCIAALNVDVLLAAEEAPSADASVATLAAEPTAAPVTGPTVSSAPVAPTASLGESNPRSRATWLPRMASGFVPGVK